MTDITASLFGDPVRGRSALDRRNGVPPPAITLPTRIEAPAKKLKRKRRGRLSEDQVRLIRLSTEPVEAIAEKFNMTIWSVYDILSKKTYADVK
jgi:hypothetical protein